METGGFIMKINLNKIAKEVSGKEGKVENIDIANIKEVIKCFIEVMQEYKSSEILEVFERWK